MKKIQYAHQPVILITLISSVALLNLRDTHAEPPPPQQAPAPSTRAQPQEVQPERVQPKRPQSERPRASQGYPKTGSKLSPALNRLNAHMHRSIRAAIAHHREHLGLLIVFERGQMKLIRDRQQLAVFSVDPPLAYHQLKVLAHIFFASMIQLQREELSHAEIKSWIEEFTPDVKTALSELETFAISDALRSSQRVFITETLALLERAAHKRPTWSELAQFSERFRPHVWENASECALLHLTQLHTQAMKLMKLLSPQEQKTIRAHLYGARGARRDRLTIQYLSWLFGENTGRESGRIVFSENISDHDKAMDMLARYGMERHLAALIFDDPERLDRDLLGDVARAHIKTFPSVEEALRQSAADAQ